jgi:hypothetical protein
MFTADDRERDNLCNQQMRKKSRELKHIRRLEAVEIHDLLQDKNGDFKAPLKLPDICQGSMNYPKDLLMEQDKCNWFAKKLFESSTFRTGCRHYLDGFLYQDLDVSKWFVLDDRNWIINVQVQQADGFLKEEETYVKVFDSSNFLWDEQNSFFNFGKELTRCGSHVRATSSDTGTMHGFGKRVFLGKLGDYVPLVSDLKANSVKHWKATALGVFCGSVTKMLCVLLKKWFPDELNMMQQIERNAGIFPSETMCGEHGITASMDVSIDLGNASHKDVGDGSPGVSTWTELYPSVAKNVSASGLTI